MAGSRILNGVGLRLARASDAEFIVALRTDSLLGQHLSVTSSDLAAQRAWMDRYAEREAQLAEFYYIIVHHDEAVGTYRIYDLKPDSFRAGSWVLRRALAPHVGLSSFVLLYEKGFFDLGLERARFEVRKANESVVRFHQLMGAQMTGEDAHQVFFEYTRDAFVAARARYVRERA